MPPNTPPPSATPPSATSSGSHSRQIKLISLTLSLISRSRGQCLKCQQPGTEERRPGRLNIRAWVCTGLSGSPHDRVSWDEEKDPDTRRHVTVNVIADGQRVESTLVDIDYSALRRELEEMQKILQGGGQRRIRFPAKARAKSFGTMLYSKFFTPPIHSRLQTARTRAIQQGAVVALNISAGDGVLASVPWEFLHEPKGTDYLVFDPYVAIARLVPGERLPLRRLRQTNILGMICAPKDLDPINYDDERRVLNTVANETDRRVSIRWVPGDTLPSLRQALSLRPAPDVFHFVGHGECDPTEGGVLALCDERQQAKQITAEAFARELTSLGPLVPQLVVLNSCESAMVAEGAGPLHSPAAQLAHRHVPAVLAMQYAVTDKAAIAFCHALYTALADGHSAVLSVKKARVALQGTGLEWGTPVLFVRETREVPGFPQTPPTPASSPAAQEQSPPAPPDNPANGHLRASTDPPKAPPGDSAPSVTLTPSGGVETETDAAELRRLVALDFKNGNVPHAIKRIEHLANRPGATASDLWCRGVLRAHRVLGGATATVTLVDALKDLEEAARVDPTDFRACQTMAAISVAQGNMADAIGHMNSAIERARAEPQLYYRRSVLRRLSGDEPGAQADMSVAIALGCTHPIATSTPPTELADAGT